MSLIASMANKKDRCESNVPGKFYVDKSCIDCDLCRDIAPDFFARDDNNGRSKVIQQPSSEAEIDLCMEALDSCPVGAIGEDGDE